MTFKLTKEQRKLNRQYRQKIHGNVESGKVVGYNRIGPTGKPYIYIQTGPNDSFTFPSQYSPDLVKVLQVLSKKATQASVVEKQEKP